MLSFELNVMIVSLNLGDEHQTLLKLRIKEQMSLRFKFHASIHKKKLFMIFHGINFLTHIT